MLTSRSGNAIILLVTMVVVMAAVSEAQFFTKTSKSIPRMGRRSDPSMHYQPPFMSSLKQKMISDLLREYGTNENLAEMYRSSNADASVRQYKLNSGNSEDDTTESFMEGNKESTDKELTNLNDSLENLQSIIGLMDQPRFERNAYLLDIKSTVS